MSEQSKARDAGRAIIEGFDLGPAEVALRVSHTSLRLPKKNRLPPKRKKPRPARS